MTLLNSHTEVLWSHLLYSCIYKRGSANSHLKYVSYIYGLCRHIWIMSAICHTYMQYEYVCFCQGSGNGGLLCRITDPSGTGPVSICYAMWGCFDSSGSSCIYPLCSPVDVQLYWCWWWSTAQPPSPAG